VTLDLTFKQRLCVFSVLSVAILAFLNTREPPSDIMRVGITSVFLDTDYGVPLFMLIPLTLGWVGIAAETRTGVITCFLLSALLSLSFWSYYKNLQYAGIFCLTGDC